MSANTYLPPTPVVPGMLLISNITNSYPMVVTIVDSIYNTYIAGQNVCLTVPPNYGMFQANELTGTIVSIDEDEFSINIDSRSFDAFTVPLVGSMPASLSPSGSRNLQFSNLTNNVPFHSLNDVGN